MEIETGILNMLYEEGGERDNFVTDDLESGEKWATITKKYTTPDKTNIINNIFNRYIKSQYFVSDIDSKIEKTEKVEVVKEVIVESRDFHILTSILEKAISLGLHTLIVGPAGSGKTQAAENVANNLKLDFYITGAIASEHKLLGFIDANGKYHRTQFRDAFERGGLFLFDEMDASFPACLLAVNAALANGYMDFPDGKVQKHENFVCIAAANTYGHGADRLYVGRNQLDAASLDRFVNIDWYYDEILESTISENKDWTKYVQNVRKVVESMKLRQVISMRASITGSKLLKDSTIDRNTVEKMVLFKGMSEADIKSIKSKIKRK